MCTTLIEAVAVWHKAFIEEIFRDSFFSKFTEGLMPTKGQQTFWPKDNVIVVQDGICMDLTKE